MRLDLKTVTVLGSWILRGFWISLVVAASGCAAAGSAMETPSSPTPHENLNSVLWVQTSAEYAALAEQAYRQADEVLDEALSDSTWTASLEQAARGGFEGLPPAVVLDVDETVLDNSAYQARLILDREAYNTESWNAWSREAAATAVPGALAFTQRADRLGITVIYLTNRRSEIEQATRRNLADLGFPLADGVDVILTRAEQEGWTASDKRPRREYVADRYRVLLLVGDNIGDFLSEDVRSLQERMDAVASYRNHWGVRWIMLPNPQYGSWEEAVIGFNYAAPPEEQLRRKLDALDARR